jgi:outer membrane scaffolding protein for murein synthesis (MipA/OmpV family)
VSAFARWLAASACAALLGVAAPCHADDAAAASADDNLLGAGFIRLPAWQGSRAHRDQFAPYVQAKLGDRITLSTDDGATLDLIMGQHLHGGLYGNYQWGRSHEDLGRLGGKVTSLSPRLNAGGYVEYDFNEAQNIGINAAHDTLGAGAYVNAYAFSALPPLGRYQHGLQLQWQWMNGPAMRRFFGLSAVEAAALGVAPWQPGAGGQQVGLEYDGLIPLGRHLATVFSLSYARLLGNAEDSPLVRGFGTADQFTGSMALVYRFAP